MVGGGTRAVRATGRMHAASFECSRLLCRPRHFSHDDSSVPRLGITTASIVLDIHLFSL
jgi:hypothetical protein